MAYAIIVSGLIYLVLTLLAYKMMQQRHKWLTRFLCIQLVRDIAITIAAIIAVVNYSPFNHPENHRLISVCIAINSFFQFTSFWLLSLKISAAAQEINGLFHGEVSNHEVTKRY